VKDRIEALSRLNESGLDTWVFIAPIIPHVTEVGLEEGLRQLAEAGVKRLMTDRYNARGMVINQTLEAYKSWNPGVDIKEVRHLLWKGDEYYRLVDARVSRQWKKAARDGIHEKVF
jgi:DNA repair photolyase